MNTKLIGILSLAVLIFTSTAKAQDDKQNNIRFGVKAGVNVSNMYTKDVDDKNTMYGFNGGLFLKIPLSENIAFQPELLYSMKGAELKYNNTFVSGTARFSLNYIDVPLLVVFNLSKNVNIHGGVYVASLMNVKIKNEGTVSLFNFENELNKDNFETLDYGLTIGAGVDLDKISLGIRYEYGMKTVGKENSILGQSYRFPDARNSTLQVYLGISLL